MRNINLQKSMQRNTRESKIVCYTIRCNGIIAGILRKWPAIIIMLIEKTPICRNAFRIVKIFWFCLYCTKSINKNEKPRNFNSFIENTIHPPRKKISLKFIITAQYVLWPYWDFLRSVVIKLKKFHLKLKIV